MNNLNFFIMIGPPGGGKGTLSKLCVDNLGWLQLSTGNLCRDHIARQTEIGKKIDFLIKSGKLISDSLITEMVGHWLVNNVSLKSPIILDGYPRTVIQIKELYKLLNDKFSLSKLNVVRLIADEEVIIKRLCSRMICSNIKCQLVYSNDPKSSFYSKKDNFCEKCNNALVQRSDDQEKAIKERLIVYNNHEKEVLDYYEELGLKVLEINADQPIENVFAVFRNYIK